jgi:hypothetical protein
VITARRENPANHQCRYGRCEYTPDSITWPVADRVHQRRTPADLGGRARVFDKPFFLTLNLAVDGHGRATRTAPRCSRSNWSPTTSP